MWQTGSRRALVELVGQCLRPAKANQRRPLPIVMLWGPRGSGKSELLHHVHQRYYRSRPVVRRGGTKLGERPHEVALQLAHHLGRRVERFGRLRFPRLLLGMTAIRGPIGAPAETREEMIRRTVPDRRLLTQWTREASAVLLDTVPSGPLPRAALGLTIKGILATLETAPLLRGRGLAWYSDGLGQRFADPVDALVELAGQEARSQFSSVDEVLCRAFLADLRDGCSNSLIHLYDRNEHCLAVLDEANSTAIQEFFDILAREREQEWDPLLIVASSARRFSVAGVAQPDQWLLRSAEEARYTDWLEHRTSYPGWTAVYPLTLGGITETEATASFAPQLTDNRERLRKTGVDLARVPGGAEHAVRLAHGLTEGHIGGLQLVLRAMTGEASRVGAEQLDVRRLFEWQVPGDVSLAEVVLRQVLDSWPSELGPVLLRSSAARDLGDISLARVLRHEPAPLRQLMREFRSRDTWVRHPSTMGNTGQPALHPFARRAVLHRLANPQPPDDHTWDTVHGHLQQLADQNGNTTTALYHALARRRVRQVVEALSDMFRRQNTPAWFNTLLAVTQAPLEDPAHQANAESHCQWLASQTGDEHRVSATLVGALQLHCDPLGDPHRELCRVIAHQLETLASHAPEGGLVFLLAQAERFRTCHIGNHRYAQP